MAVVELSIVMPCLNEAETLAACIRKAQLGLERAGVEGEIIIADNGSTDGSQTLSEGLGARVISVTEKGYGSALRGGIAAARGRWIIMGDADDSYDFSEAPRFIEKLREGADLVMGCRMPRGGGTILPGAMPWKHRWIGNPVLSFIGRLFFRSEPHDFHCGLRGFTKAAYEQMTLQTTGMEFASEMVIKATLQKMRIAEVPITLHPDGRSRPPHLRSWRDGWRHLRFMLLFSPRWLFLVPGLLLGAAGVAVAIPLSLGPVYLGNVRLDVGTLAFASTAIVIGFQIVTFGFFTKVFAIAEGLFPQDARFARWFKYLGLETGILLGLALLFAGIALLGKALWHWEDTGFGLLSYAENMRQVIPATTLVMLGIQTVFSSFFMSVLGLKTSTRTPPMPAP